MRTHLDLFSGIGGFALAARWVGGIETIGFSETDHYCSAVLKKHWPGVRNYGDVRAIQTGELAGRVWLVTGGFPCQPFSVAGKRGGKSDDRWLWPAMRNVVVQVRPTWIIGENVPGIIGMELDGVLSDLAAAGYQQQTFIVPACAVDAKHRRDRVWIVAHSERVRRRKSPDTSPSEWETFHSQIRQESSPRIGSGRETLSHAIGTRLEIRREQSAREECEAAERSGESPEPSRWPVEPQLGRVAHGISNRVDRLKSIGNSIVPQVAEKFIRWIVQAEEQLTA